MNIGWEAPRATTELASPSSWVSQRAETYVHSSTVFVKEASLDSDRPSVHSVRLHIQEVPPKHLDEAADLQRDAEASWTFKWTVVASVNVVRGRDQKRQRKVKVKLPELLEQRVGAKVRISKPRKRTGPSA